MRKTSKPERKEGRGRRPLLPEVLFKKMLRHSNAEGIPMQTVLYLWLSEGEKVYDKKFQLEEK